MKIKISVRWTKIITILNYSLSEEVPTTRLVFVRRLL